MNSIVIDNLIETTRRHFQVPATPRGRALRTVDWFLNGQQAIENHDDRRIPLTAVRGN